MKYLLLFLGFSLFQSQPDFELVKKQAAAQHKLILLNFSGSDWCAPCILMRKDYFENEEFISFADASLLIINSDFPRRKKNQLPPALSSRNAELAEAYNKHGNFPLTLLLDSNGKVLRSWTGKPDVPVQDWIREIRSVYDANK